MVFTLSSTSKHGTAYYKREGFKQQIAIPSGHFAGGTVPQTLDVSAEAGEGTFAEKPAARGGSVSAALKAASPEVKKAVNEARRKAEREALASAGVSL